jgi:hypothetical protein
VIFLTNQVKMRFLPKIYKQGAIKHPMQKRLFVSHKPHQNVAKEVANPNLVQVKRYPDREQPKVAPINKPTSNVISPIFVNPADRKDSTVAGPQLTGMDTNQMIIYGSAALIMAYFIFL